MRKPTSFPAGSRTLVALLLLAASQLWATDAGPDKFGYRATSATVYTFLDLVNSGGGASVLAGTDDATTVLTLPFTFAFYGKSYTMACVSSNGILYFVTSSAACNISGDFANVDIANTPVPGDLPAIAPFWMDLAFQSAAGGAVYYQTVGTVGSRQFILEWYNAYPVGSLSPVTFELILNETSNTILFQYQTVDLGSGNAAADGAKATIGVRDTGGNTNGRALEWSYDAAVVTNSSAILWTSFSPCDVNQDNQTTVTDVQSIINQALGKSSPTSDLNSDGVVNVVDLQLVLNAVLSGGTCIL